jgi:hypothetical protein
MYCFTVNIGGEPQFYCSKSFYHTSSSIPVLTQLAILSEATIGARFGQASCETNIQKASTIRRLLWKVTSWSQMRQLLAWIPPLPELMLHQVWQSVKHKYASSSDSQELVYYVVLAHYAAARRLQYSNWTLLGGCHTTMKARNGITSAIFQEPFYFF